MPPIPLLDSALSLRFAEILSLFIKAGMPVFSLLSVCTLWADFQAWKPRTFRAYLGKWLVNFLVFSLMLFCILYGLDGRYSQCDIDAYAQTGETYFGQQKNGVPDGFGKVFRSDGSIAYIGCFAGGQKDGEGMSFSQMTKDGFSYLLYEGTYRNGLRDGTGKLYCLCNGQPRLIYEGELSQNVYDGSGLEQIYDVDGNLAATYQGAFVDGERTGFGVYTEFAGQNKVYEYTGGWAYGEKYGYGVQKNSSDGAVFYAYRGLYWKGKPWGKGIEEYHNKDGIAVLWNGILYDGQQTEDGAYYYQASGQFWATESNGSIAYDENGNSYTDEARMQELMNKWPFPEELLLGKGTGIVWEIVGD